jgi:hypothetical protein
LLLGSDAVLYYGVEKGVTCRCAERIIPDFPVHPIFLSEKYVEAQFLEREDATERKQILEAGYEEDVCV